MLVQLLRGLTSCRGDSIANEQQTVRGSESSSGQLSSSLAAPLHAVTASLPAILLRRPANAHKSLPLIRNGTGEHAGPAVLSVNALVKITHGRQTQRKCLLPS